MSEAAAQIAREAKGLQQALKELLKNRDILDKDIDICRKNLRREYLRLLLLYPYAKESKDAETHLWMQTSYSLISIYKQRISSLDRAIFGPSRQAQAHQPQQRNVVEYRKLLQRFRQFLAEEEKFYTQLVIRLRRNFAIDAAQRALDKLEIPIEQEPPPQDTRRNHFQFPPESDEVIAELLPTSAAQRDSRLAIFSKALVCLGDIARYKEQYNESGNRPRAGHEDGPPANAGSARNRGRRGGAPSMFSHISRMRNYDRAIACYEQARLLTPHDGNPCHQMAIVASYQKDIYASLTHYYRALCVRTPFETASENMGSLLHKTLEQWKTRRANGEGPLMASHETLDSPRIRVELFQEKIVILHAQWRFGGNEVDLLSEEAAQYLHRLVSECHLPEELINKAIVLSQGALWKYRMIRPTSHSEKRIPRSPLTESRMATHLLSLHRVMLDAGYLQLEEAKKTPETDIVGNDLAQRSTAAFRRMLPALRMAGKWIRANTRYLSQARDSTDPDIANGAHAPRSRRTRDGRGGREKGAPVVIKDLRSFWEIYVKFMNELVAAFPEDKLPELTMPLDEDIEMLGFLPLRKYLLTEPKGPSLAQGNTALSANGIQPAVRSHEGVHPNEEQLMRIADIFVDAKAVAEDEVTPVTFVNKFVLNLPAPTDASRTNIQPTGIAADINGAMISADLTGNEEPSDIDDDAASRTETDIVADAFRQVLEDEELILYPSSRATSPAEPLAAVPSLGPTSPHTVSPLSPISPRSPPYSPRKGQPISPISPPQKSLKSTVTPPRAPVAPSGPGPTAADLLNIKLTRGSAPIAHKPLPSNPMFLSTGPSIWSTTTENTSLHSTTISAPSTRIPSDPIHRPSPFQQLEPPVGTPQSSWSRFTASQPAPSSSYIGGTAPWNQGLQTIPGLDAVGHQRTVSQSIPGVSPIGRQRTVSQTLSSMNTISHQRVASEQLFPSRPLTAQHLGQQYDPRPAPLLPREPFNPAPGSHPGVTTASQYPEYMYPSAAPSGFYQQESRDVFGSASPFSTHNSTVDQRVFPPAPFLPVSSVWNNSG